MGPNDHAGSYSFDDAPRPKRKTIFDEVEDAMSGPDSRKGCFFFPCSFLLVVVCYLLTVGSAMAARLVN